jgi:hypothetical protein
MADFTPFSSQYGIRNSLINNPGTAALTGEKNSNYDADNLFQGVWRLNQDNLHRFDPFITGYAFFIWLKKPAFFDEGIWKNFKALTERNFKALSGISSMTLAADDLNMGFAGNILPVPTNMPKENNSFSLNHYELAGSPVREGYQYWVTGIRDPETGLATYHGKINQDGMKYSLKNHTAEAIYIVTDPSGASLYAGSRAYAGIEFACYYTNVFPTKIPQDHLNYTAGDHSASQEIDIEFRGCFHQSRAINELAKTVMEQYFIKKTYGDYGDDTSGTLTKEGYALHEKDGYNQAVAASSSIDPTMTTTAGNTGNIERR